MFKLIKLNQKLNLINLINLRCLNTVLNNRFNQLNKERIYLIQKRYDSKKEMDEINEFLKTNKNSFFDVNDSNQTETEDQLTRKELLLFYGSIVFAITVAISFLILYKVEKPQKIDYEKFAYNPTEVVKPLDTKPLPETIVGKLIKEA